MSESIIQLNQALVALKEALFKSTDCHNDDDVYEAINRVKCCIKACKETEGLV
jgi:hypothetical protein